MASRRSRCLPGVAILAALAVAPAAAHAQFVTVEARAGVVTGAGKYADALEVGQTLGVGLSTRYTPSLSLRLDADAATGFFGGPDTPDIYSYMLGLESDLVPSRSRVRTPLQLTATLQGGVTQLHYGSTAAFDAENRFRPAVGAGLRLTANLTRTLGIFGGASATATFLGGERGTLATQRSPLDEGGTLVTIPIVAGVRVRF